MKHVSLFDELSKIFALNGYRLYMIGGTSRDYLLEKEIKDYDFVSDATPSEMKKFLPEADYTFSKYGSIHFVQHGQNVDITTLRIEGEYTDFRHPSFIEYTKDIFKDFIRRDFTINAIYIDEYYKIHDFCNGVEDLKKGVIRFIGIPDKRVQEDPLRILRAERFALRYNFIIDKVSKQAMDKYYHLISKIQKNKVDEENKKQ